MPSKVSYVAKKKRRHFEFAYFSFFLTHLELKRKIRSYTPVVPSKTIPDSRPKWAKCIPVFRPKRPQNHTLWGGYLYGLYKEVPPPGFQLNQQISSSERILSRVYFQTHRGTTRVDTYF